MKIPKTMRSSPASYRLYINIRPPIPAPLRIASSILVTRSPCQLALSSSSGMRRDWCVDRVGEFDARLCTSPWPESPVYVPCYVLVQQRGVSRSRYPAMDCRVLATARLHVRARIPVASDIVATRSRIDRGAFSRRSSLESISSDRTIAVAIASCCVAIAPWFARKVLPAARRDLPFFPFLQRMRSWSAATPIRLGTLSPDLPFAVCEWSARRLCNSVAIVTRRIGLSVTLPQTPVNSSVCISKRGVSLSLSLFRLVYHVHAVALFALLLC